MVGEVILPHRRLVEVKISPSQAGRTARLKVEDISEQNKMIAFAKSQLSDLRTQMEEDYSLIRLDDFEIPKAEGVFQSYTSNGPGVLTESYRRTLAEATLNLSIKPLSTEEGKQKSASRTMTEHLARGAIWTANQRLLSVPSGIDLQSGWAQDSTERGGTVTRCYLHIAKVHGEDKLIPDLATWDAYNTYWLEGEEGPLWVCHFRYGTKKQISDEYGTDKLIEDNMGRVVVYDIWTREEAWAFSGDEWLGDLVEHNLGYVPVFIRPVGGKQHRQGERSNNTFKDSWFPAIGLNRGLYEIRNRLMSLIFTQAGIQAKPPRKVLSKDGRFMPDGDIIQMGGEIPLATDLGQDIQVFPLTTPLPLVFQMLAEVNREISLGGTAPIALGYSDITQTASGIAQLSEAARQSLNPFKKGIEEAARWTAEEVTKQYKNGKFEETELEGYESNGKKFKVLVNPSQINENEHFTAELNLNLMRDKISEMALIEKGIQLGIMSRRQGQELFNDDPDLVQEQIDREKVREVLGEPFWNVLEPMLEDARATGKFGGLFMNALLQKVIEMSGTAPRQAGAPAAPAPTAPKQLGAPVGAEVGQVAAEPMTDAMRLQRMGLVPGR